MRSRLDEVRVHAGAHFRRSVAATPMRRRGACDGAVRALVLPKRSGRAAEIDKPKRSRLFLRALAHSTEKRDARPENKMSAPKLARSMLYHEGTQRGMRESVGRGGTGLATCALR